MIPLSWSRFEPGKSREMLSLEAACLGILLIQKKLMAAVILNKSGT
jgi:hypothetical protein